MKMRSVFVLLLLTSGSALYAMRFSEPKGSDLMQFPVYEDPQLYESLVTHAMRLRAHLPAEIKQAQQKLQQSLIGNPDQAAISEMVGDLIKLYLQKLEMDLTLTYINRADRFIRNCQKKIDKQKAEFDAIQNQLPLRASGGEYVAASSALLPETVLPETVVKKPKVPVVSAEEEEEAEKQAASEEVKGEEALKKKKEKKKEEPSKLEKKIAEDTKILGKKETQERMAIKQALDEKTLAEAKKYQEQEKEGTAPEGWRDYIMKKYQDAKDWYYGTGTEGVKEEE